MTAVLTILFLFFQVSENIVVKDQWVRPGAKGMGTALYFTAENTGTEADTLYAVTSEVSDMIMLHETYSKGDMKGMKKVKAVVIEPGKSVKFNPGGKHVMVMNLKKDIKIGDEVEFILHFKNAGDISITAEAKR